MNPMNFGVPPLPPQMPPMVPNTQPQLQGYPRQQLNTLYDGPPGFAPIPPIYAHPRPNFYVRSAPYFQPPPTHRNLMPPTPDQVYGPSSMQQPFQLQMAPHSNHQPLEQPRYYGPSPPIPHPWNLPMPQQWNHQQVAPSVQSRYYGPPPPIPHPLNHHPNQQFFYPPVQLRYFVPPPPMPHPQFQQELPPAVPASYFSPTGIQYHYMDLPLPLLTNSPLLNVDQSRVLNNVNAFRITSDDETKQESRPSSSEPPTKQKKVDLQEVPSQLPASSSNASNGIQQHQQPQTSSKSKKSRRPKPPQNVPQPPQNMPQIPMLLAGAVVFKKYGELPQTTPIPGVCRLLVESFTINPPQMGIIDDVEIEIHKKINDNSPLVRDPPEWDFLDYLILCVETLGDLETLTFERFVAAVAYNGKGRMNKKARYLDHFKDLLHQVGAPKKLFALLELLKHRKGVILFIANTFVNNSMSFCFENSIIQLLKEQLSNAQDGHFRGLEINSEGTPISCRDDLKEGEQIKYNVTLEQRQRFGIRNLYEAYCSFMLQNHFVIRWKNFKDVVKNYGRKLSNKSIDQNQVSSLYSYFLTPEFSPPLIDCVTKGGYDGQLYLQRSKIFKKRIPEKCYVYVMIDGSKLPQFGKINDCNIAFEEYLNSIFCVGIHNDFFDVFNYTMKNKNPDDSFNEITQGIIDKNNGIFLQSLFTMTCEDEAILRKSAMISMLKNELYESLDIQIIKNLSQNQIENKEEFAMLGIGSLDRFWKSFVRHPPTRLRVTP